MRIIFAAIARWWVNAKPVGKLFLISSLNRNIFLQMEARFGSGVIFMSTVFQRPLKEYDALKQEVNNVYKACRLSIGGK